MSETRPGTYAEGVEHGLFLKQHEINRMGERIGKLQAENNELQIENSELRMHIVSLNDYIAQLEEVLRSFPNPNVSLSA